MHDDGVGLTLITRAVFVYFDIVGDQLIGNGSGLGGVGVADG